MDSSTRVGLYMESSRLMRLVAYSATICLMAGIPGVAFAQLRSGKTSRELYRGERQASDVRTAGAQVVQAGYLRASPAMYESGHNDEVVSAACHGCDSGCADCGGIIQRRLVDNGCSCGDCDSPTCDACIGNFSEIAPTCMTICPPGTSPLMALWCRLQVRAELPIYWRPGQGPPPLVTSATPGTPADVAGQLGDPDTVILVGDQVLSTNPEAGFRITLNTWLGAQKQAGLVFRYWNAGDQNDVFQFNSNTTPILARPFLNTTVAGSPEQDTQLVAFPGNSEGTISVSASSKVNGLELSLRRLLYMDRFTRVDWLYGYQFASVDEMLGITTNTNVTGNVPGLQGTSLAVSDQFQTTNDFNGFMYGITGTRHVACFKLESTFRLGMGNLRRRVNIAGQTVTTSNGVSVTQNQGLLARFTNSQPFQDDTFVVLPEIGFNVAYQVCSSLDFNIGYNYMMIPNVAQAAQQINPDLAVNLSDPLVGALDPSLEFSERKYTLHSLGFGFQLRY